MFLFGSAVPNRTLQPQVTPTPSTTTPNALYTSCTDALMLRYITPTVGNSTATHIVVAALQQYFIGYGYSCAQPADDALHPQEHNAPLKHASLRHCRLHTSVTSLANDMVDECLAPFPWDTLLAHPAAGSDTILVRTENLFVGTSLCDNFICLDTIINSVSGLVFLGFSGAG